MSGFLTRQEVEHLTKRKTRPKQIAILRRRGIRFTLDGNGWPVVTWAAVEPPVEKPAFALGEVS